MKSRVKLFHNIYSVGREGGVEKGEATKVRYVVTELE